MKTPKWELWKDENGKWHFHPKAANGEVVGYNDYESEQAARDGIAVIKGMGNAPIVKLKKQPK